MRTPTKRKLDKLSLVHDQGYAAAAACMPCDAPTTKQPERKVWETGWRAYHRHAETPYIDAQCAFCGEPHSFHRAASDNSAAFCMTLQSLPGDRFVKGGN